MTQSCVAASSYLVMSDVRIILLLPSVHWSVNPRACRPCISAGASAGRPTTCSTRAREVLWGRGKHSRRCARAQALSPFAFLFCDLISSDAVASCGGLRCRSQFVAYRSWASGCLCRWIWHRTWHGHWSVHHPCARLVLFAIVQQHAGTVRLSRCPWIRHRTLPGARGDTHAGHKWQPSEQGTGVEHALCSRLVHNVKVHAVGEVNVGQ